ncbi:MAG: YajD family HNH nuclease [Mariprofundaceae bacterium]
MIFPKKSTSNYREKALKMYPWVCGRCGRDFTGKKLKELTVHHKDHNHDNNPADGSNWELLCIYCHDNEHQRFNEMREISTPDEQPASTSNPFANLEKMMNETKS